MLEVDSPAHAFTAIVTLLQMYADVESLAALVRNTPEMTGLVLGLWALEVRDSLLSTQLRDMFPNVCPPTAVRLLDIHLFDRRDFDKCGAFLISALEGSLSNTAIAEVGLEHIRRNSSALSRLPIPWVLQNLHINLRNLNSLHSTPLHFLLSSQNSVGVVTEALVALTSRPFDAASAGTATGCITQICDYLGRCITSDGLTSLKQSLVYGLLVGLLKAYPWLDYTKPEFSPAKGLLAVHLPKYLIYISVLRQVHKSFNVARQLGLMDAQPEAFRNLWLAFETYARVRLKLATDLELEVEPCNSPEVGPF
jgi:hypothetical protein